MMFGEELTRRAAAIIDAARKRRMKIATAESCTGGLIAGLFTEIAGSSDVLERGFVSYSNAAKAEMLGVPATLIAAQGAVSDAVARAMAEGALKRTPAALTIAVTGIAGPGGGTAAKPVGRVHFALARHDVETVHVQKDFGDAGRSEVRRATIAQALAMIEAALDLPPN